MSARRIVCASARALIAPAIPGWGWASWRLGLGLAMALATVADAHPDSLAGLLAHPDEDPRAGELVRPLAELGRAALDEPQEKP